MKRFSLKKTIYQFFSFVVGVALLAGCGANGGTSVVPTDQQAIDDFINTLSSKTTFLITDAPSDDYKSVMVDIQSPFVVIQNGRSVDVPLPGNQPIRVDLLELRDIADSLGSVDLPAGNITEIRMTLANPELTDLDGKVIDSNGMDLTPEVVIKPDAAIDVASGTSTTVEIDIDVESSIRVDASGRPIFRPNGKARHLRPDLRPEDEREAKRLLGEIVEIGIKDHPDSFLLKIRGRRHFIPVDASTASIFKGEEKASTTFEALAKGQKVGVSGTWKGDFLKARHVVILPEGLRGMRGVIRHLERTDRGLVFDLVFLHHRDRDIDATSADVRPLDDVATRTDVVKVHVMAETKIVLDGPHDRMRELEPSDLTKGQLVTVHGKKDTESRLIHARMIAIHPESFRAWVVGNEGCPAHIRVAKPFSELHRFDRADVDLGPHNSGIVEITNKTKIIGKDGQSLSCADLGRGTAVRVFGMMIPPVAKDMDPQVRAFVIHRLPAEYGRVEGTVVKVAEDGMSFVLEVAPRTAGFDTATTTVELRVIVSEQTHYGERIATSTGNGVTPELKGKRVMAAGFFHKIKEERMPHLHALAVTLAPTAPLDGGGTISR